MTFATVGEHAVDPTRAHVYVSGWQSWSPSGVYPVTAPPPRPATDRWQTMCYRPGRPAPARAFQGEGLLAVTEDPDGDTTVYLAPDPTREMPSMRARLVDSERLVVEADGPVAIDPDPRPLGPALADVGDRLAAGLDLATPTATIPAGWCSWYRYYEAVREADVLANLAAADRLGLELPIFQVDDGYQAGIGDWLERSPAFGPLRDLAARIQDTGRIAGIWTAPFLAGADSRLARDHPDWLVGGAEAADQHWGQSIRVLDVTNPRAAEHLAAVYRTLVDWGFRYHKIDFLYAGAMHGARAVDAEPLAAYRSGIELIREALGPDTTLLGCGAPLLPSIGLFDAMRVSADVDAVTDPARGDLSQPSIRSALTTGRARAWMHARLWVNDPDCLLARPEVAARDEWAGYVAALGGLHVSSDALEELDDHGLELTRRLDRPSRAQTVTWDPFAGSEQGRLAGEAPA